MFRAVAVAAVLAVMPTPARAGECRTISVDYLPAESPNVDPGLRFPLQIVAWVETTSGVYVDTVFITHATGTYGLGNRPGRFDFNSAPLWPYGRRTTVFPVWAHKKGMDFPLLEFQDGNDSNLSHSTGQSSRDARYCAPIARYEAAWDAGSCASVSYTDKGVWTSGRSLYPPRQDHVRQAPLDVAQVDLFAMLNPFDAVSHATPPSGQPAAFSWAMPATMPAGDYVLWLEVSREFDQNDAYAYPSPTGIPWSMYGLAYRGQPSVVYSVPFAVGGAEIAATTRDYAGYGDPDGLDGNVRAPDGTITTDMPGSGAARLAIVPGGDYRVRVVARSEQDFVAPAAAMDLAVAATTNRSVTLEMIAPGDDGTLGPLRGYEVRYAIGDAITEETFASAIALLPSIDLVDAGDVQTIILDRLLPETTYTLAIRAVDDCGNAGPITTIDATTLSREGGEVDACFVATAAYGTAMVADVEPLRAFRDAVLRKTVLGELAVQTYYTFGPAVAGLVGESELLRATARAILAPLVTAARAVRF